MQNLYRHYNKQNNLLYVGVSLRILQRLGEHEQNSVWFNQISRVEITQYKDRQDALQKEKLAIQTEKPIFNLSLNTALRGNTANT